MDEMDKYVLQVNMREEKKLNRQRAEGVKECKRILSLLMRKGRVHSKDIKFIKNTMIPYVRRMKWIPPSYKSMIDGYEELIKFGKRVNRRIW